MQSLNLENARRVYLLFIQLFRAVFTHLFTDKVVVVVLILSSQSKKVNFVVNTAKDIFFLWKLI